MSSLEDDLQELREQICEYMDQLKSDVELNSYSLIWADFNDAPVNKARYREKHESQRKWARGLGTLFRQVAEIQEKLRNEEYATKPKGENTE